MGKLRLSFWTTMLFVSIAMAAPDWTDSLSDAIAQKNGAAIGKIMTGKKGSPGFVADFSQVVGKLKRTPGYVFEYTEISNVFDKSLMKGFEDKAYSEYKAIINDPGAPVEARSILLKILMRGDGKMPEKRKKETYGLMLSLLNDSAANPDLRTLVLRKIGIHPNTKDHRLFISYLNSPLFRSSAYRGLGQMVRRNVVEGKTSENRLIFDDLTSGTSDSLEDDKVRVLAQISENYARDFLLVRCSGNPEQIKTIFFHDANMEHPKLIAEAILLSQDKLIGQEMENAIRHGMRSPSKTIDKLLFGNDEDLIVGLRLLRLFPNLVGAHQQFITEFFTNSDSEIRRSAMALIPYFKDPRAAIGQSMELAKSASDKADFEMEITRALTGGVK